MAETSSEGAFLDSEEREHGLVYRLTVRRPGKINVLGAGLLDDLHRALDKVAEDSSARLLILTGGGERSFIGGADIRELAELGPESARPFISRLHGVCQKLRNLEIPAIARIHGYCLGAGMEVAASCDVRVACLGARFGMPEVRVGIPSVIEAALLPRLMGIGNTAEILLTGRIFGAEEAHRMGFLERLVSSEELDDTVEQLVAAMLEAGPRALALQKELLRDWLELPLSEAIEAGVDAFERAYRTDEPKRYLGSFLERQRSR